MAVKIAKREVTKLNCCGGVRESIKIAGKTFVCKEAPQWETVWSGSQSFTGSGSFTVSGLGTDGEATVTANAVFNVNIYDENSGGWQSNDVTLSVTDKSLPCTITDGYASIDISRSGSDLNFSFVPYGEEYKGYVIYINPMSVTFTNVKKKL